MKSQLFRASSILAAITLLAAFGLSGRAQQPTRRPPAEQQEREIPELMVQQSTETLRARVPQECVRLNPRPEVQTHNASTGVTPSPALLSFMGTHARKGYNNPAVNTYFGDSFKIRSCMVCYATIEAKVRHYADIWQNDGLTAGVAPFGANRVFASGLIWPTTFPWALSTGPLNTYISSPPGPGKTVDVFAQDDTDFNSVQLTVWYY